MTKPEVIGVLGTPTEAGTSGNGIEIFRYNGNHRGIEEDQIVVFKNGKTIRYGPNIGEILKNYGIVFGD